MANIDELKAADGTLNAEAIMKIIPYGSNFLMVDKVTLLEKRRVQATKKSDLKQFEGHFRDFPLMPGALIIEGLGQAATLLLRYNLPNHETKEILAYKIKEAKFSLPTFPGDELLFDVQMAGMDERGALMQGSASVKGQKVSECTMMLSIVDRQQFRGRYAK
ncbi:hypothetical protein J4419_00525 [Candidatus Woesearchaeota archaeon]|nr:hypothetical protein [Candidatus Woesearchaeota archaeon]